MKVFGLIGFPLSHSFSKKYFTEKFQNIGTSESYRYENFELPDISEFVNLIEQHVHLTGLNVTIPYKEKVIPFLNELDSLANEIGAVNTIKITRDLNGKCINLKGYNTDAIGFEKTISPFLKSHHTGALILGTGGASKAVAYVLKQKKIEYRFVSSNPLHGNLGYGQLTEEVLNKFPVIINTTPLGTFPEISAAPPIPYHLLGPLNLLYDLVYNPPLTEFMKRGIEQGATVSNGYQMLVEQAEAAWEIWNQ